MARAPLLRDQRTGPAARLQPVQASSGGNAMLGRVLGQFANYFDDRADRAAEREGAAAGAEAGLYMNFRAQADDTIRARSFNAAALRTYGQQLDGKIRLSIDRIAREHAGRPEDVTVALAAMQENYLTGTPEQLQPGIRALFGRLGTTVIANARDQLDRNVAAQDAATYQESFRLRVSSINAMAASGDLDGVTAEMSGVQTQMIAHGPKHAFTWRGVEYEADPARSGLMTVATMDKQFADLERATRKDIVFGEFHRLPLADQVVFADRFESDFLAGNSQLNGTEFRALHMMMQREIGRSRGGAASVQREFKSAFRDAERIAEQGLPIDPAFRQDLQAKAQAAGPEAMDALATWQQLQEFGEVFSGLSLQEQRGVLSANIAMAKDGATPDEAARIDIMRSRHAAARKLAARDLIAYGQQKGEIPQRELPAAGGPPRQKYFADMSRHAADFATMEGMEGLTIGPMTQNEIAAHAAWLKDASVDDQISYLADMVQGAGTNGAAAVLAQLTPKEPRMAHIGSLYGRDDAWRPVMREALIGRALRREGQGLAPDTLKTSAATFEELNGVFRLASAKVRNTVLETAMDIYTARAAAEGLAPDEFKEELWRDAIHAAVGHDGRAGGIGEVNGGRIILPAGMTADDVEALLDNSVLKYWQELPGGVPAYADGKPVELDVLKSARLVLVEGGRYQISIGGDPDNGDYRFVRRKDAAVPYQLDIQQLRDVRLQSLADQGVANDDWLAAQRAEAAARKQRLRNLDARK